MIYTEKKLRSDKSFDACGIYKIHLSKDRYYIGSAVSMRKRWLRHINESKQGKHANANLNNKRSLRFSIVVICLLEEIKFHEESLIDLSDPKCVNITKKHHGGDTLSNNPNKERINASKRKPKLRSKISVDGSIYNSMAEASRVLGVHVNTVQYRVKSDQFLGYKYEQ